MDDSVGSPCKLDDSEDEKVRISTQLLCVHADQCEQSRVYSILPGTWNLQCERIDQLYTVFAGAKQLEKGPKLETINDLEGKSAAFSGFP